MKRFFRTKSRDHMLSDLASGHQLHRALGPWHLTFLGIGAVIGAGIFVLTGVAAAKYAGPAISLSFVLSGVACAFAGLCYAEFASMLPVAGSAYTYSYATLGELFAWIIGWDLILEYLFGASANFNNLIVLIKVAVILLFIGCCTAFINTANWTPFVPPNSGEIGVFGWTGVLRGAAVVFFAYIGFDAVSTAAQESRNPQRDMPIGILASLAVCAVLYVAVSLVLTGIVNYKLLDVPDPIAVGIDAYEQNTIDWTKLASAPRVAGVIHRASCGLIPDRAYAARRAEARKRGYLWGAYHVGTSDNAVQQADLFLRTIGDARGELLALDLEDVTSNKFMNVAQAQVFLERVHQKVGRYPLVYASHQTLQAIRRTQARSNVWSRTRLWYARYTDAIADFPAGVWRSYTLWQFASELRSGATRGAAYFPIPGTRADIDVSVYGGTVEELRRAWPLDGRVSR